MSCLLNHPRSFYSTSRQQKPQKLCFSKCTSLTESSLLLHLHLFNRYFLTPPVNFCHFLCDIFFKPTMAALFFGCILFCIHFTSSSPYPFLLPLLLILFFIAFVHYFSLLSVLLSIPCCLSSVLQIY